MVKIGKSTLKSKKPRSKFPSSQFRTRKITVGVNAGKTMVRFKPPGSETFHTLAILDTATEGRDLIARMKKL